MKDYCPIKSTQVLMLAEAAALLVLWGVSDYLFGVTDALRITAALTLAYVVPRVAYSRWHDNHPVGRWILFVAALWLVVIAVAFLWDCSVGSFCTLERPCLDGDMADYYQWALHRFDPTVEEPKVTFWGYSWGIMMLWRLTGVNVVWPVAMNVMATLLTLVVTACMGVRVLHGRVAKSQAQVGAWCMGLLAVQGFFISQGAQMLKEPWIYLSITLMGYAIAGVVSVAPPSRRHRWMDVALYAIGCFVLAAVRAKYVNFMAIGVLLLAPVRWRRNWRFIATLFIITAMCWWLGMAMTTHYTVIQQVNNVTGSGGMETIFVGNDAFWEFSVAYYTMPLWQKVLSIPITCGVQWMIPFPWLPQGDAASILTCAPRLRWGWYAVSGLVAWFYLVECWRKPARAFALWALFPAVCFSGIAYMVVGTVSRYVLPFAPWVVVLAVWVLLRPASPARGRWLVRWLLA
ncbi:MAG: hypothetical protein IJ808_01115, partial [Muribaculaceae bacterium]|nr:hypothetical protein [Muribaculaceae bacterium]